MSMLIEVGTRFIDVDAVFWVRYVPGDEGAADHDRRRPWLQVWFRGREGRFEIFGNDVEPFLMALQQRKERDERDSAE